MTKYFLFDSETGGVPEKKTSLLTVYGMLLDQKFEISDTIDLKIKPDDGVYVIEPYAMTVNGIDLMKHDKEAIGAAEASHKFIDFITRNNIGTHKIIPVGHNVAFDIAFMKQLIGGTEWRRMFSKKAIDTASIAEFLCATGILPPSEEVDCSLAGLAARFDFSYAGAHDAEFDAKLTLKVLKKLQALVQERKTP